ncbi:MAG: XTP/dITP diphosphatase [Lachnospiraceae bacterium]|nr:XTP/dITP diphosphatase [Lachnospiraceae bacterium]
MQRIIFATGNQGKMREIRRILENLTIKGELTQILSMKDAGIDIDIEENGTTFEENAVIKAKAVGAEAKDAIVLADDSGLVIDHLNGEPGIYSARYMGEDTSYRIKNASLIERLSGVEDEKRTARFVCAIAAAMPDGTVFTETGTIEGRIGYEEKGENGFGYDPIFYVPEYGKTTAELTEDEKNEVSHRGKALRAVRKRLEENV